MKVFIFNEYYQRVSLFDCLYYKAFPTILIGITLKYYQTNIINLFNIYKDLHKIIILNFEEFKY